jgi:hypothetical protein
MIFNIGMMVVEGCSGFRVEPSDGFPQAESRPTQPSLGRARHRIYLGPKE